MRDRLVKEGAKGEVGERTGEVMERFVEYTVVGERKREEGGRKVVQREVEIAVEG